MSKSTKRTAVPGRYVALGCSHGNEQDDQAIEKACRFIEEYRPEYLIHLGDAFDFAALRNGASDEEQALSIADDVAAGLALFKRLRKLAPKLYFLRGNHDERAWELCEKGRALQREYGKGLVESITRSVVNEYGFTMLPYYGRDNFLRPSNTTFLHGYAHGENAAKTHCEKLKTDCMFAHTHGVADVTFPGAERPVQGISVGCLRSLNPRYASRNLAPLRWEHAIGYGEFREHNDLRRVERL